jgi:hypothetical protein
MPAKKKKSTPDELTAAYFDQIAKAIGIELVDPVAQAYEAEQAAEAAEEEAA